MADDDGDVHVMPNDDKHSASVDCWCRPVQDNQNRRDIAQGLSSLKLWIHNEAN